MAILMLWILAKHVSGQSPKACQRCNVNAGFELRLKPNPLSIYTLITVTQGLDPGSQNSMGVEGLIQAGSQGSSPIAMQYRCRSTGSLLWESAKSIP